MEKTIKNQFKQNIDVCKRFILIGSESTGKSTLARKLLNHFRRKGGDFSSTQLVEEYGREYTIIKLAQAQALANAQNKPPVGMESLIWTEEDFLNIAYEQNRLEDKAAQSGSPIVICDTDSFATAIWHERYRNYWPQSFDSIIANLPKRELYLLMDHNGIAFHADEIRDGEKFRAWMTKRFEEEMKKRNFPFIKLKGDRRKRLRIAIEEITKRI